MPPPRDVDETVSLQLRISERLRQQLAEAARDSGRSLNSEIAQRLVKSLGAEGPPSLMDAERAELEQRLRDFEGRLLANRAQLEQRLHESWDAERTERARLLDTIHHLISRQDKIDAMRVDENTRLIEEMVKKEIAVLATRLKERT
jgi:hypothetical protein